MSLRRPRFRCRRSRHRVDLRPDTQPKCRPGKARRSLRVGGVARLTGLFGCGARVVGTRAVRGRHALGPFRPPRRIPTLHPVGLAAIRHRRGTPSVAPAATSLVGGHQNRERDQTQGPNAGERREPRSRSHAPCDHTGCDEVNSATLPLRGGDQIGDFVQARSWMTLARSKFRCSSRAAQGDRCRAIRALNGKLGFSTARIVVGRVSGS